MKLNESNYITRKATLEDLPSLLKFEQELIQTERPMDKTIREGNISYYSIESFIKSEEIEVIVAEFQGEIIASGYAKIIEDRHYLKHRFQGYLGFMFVKELHRGKGVNKQIVDSLILWCKAKGVYEIRLDVYDKNPQAIKAYEKAGFEKHLITMRLDARNH
ncbi:GNAT family N-acetyltransferase [Lutimonas saemankumensis]|uniref:GNAT family N-acetyltransferase n=1 Tax=Lutimonas saemankumensis TaxID=483016 RepID=UPI001CD4EBE9|nr:GNAT family N-acetyltransferase [Lutimonas saemankumensis]MCA0933389.1 GNAT family N-acetyltransferase [Lutimonas saemankumensis]